VIKRVGSYEMVRILARGGMSTVYLAHQPALDREVALKQLELETGDPTVAQRFVREARLAAGLDHPNVVTLFDFFEDGGVPYIAMEYVSGGSLRPLVGRLSFPQVFGALEGVLAGLAHAESRGIVHRDLKPENVLITRGGGVKIADFGIARAYNALTPSLTSTGSAIGTPAYMAPEQVLDEPLGPHTDLYALGVVAYELLAGRPPFLPSQTPMAVLYCHVHKPPPPLADLAPDVPVAVRGWAEWMLAKPPSQRPGSAAEAWEALEEIAVAELGPYWRRSAAIAAPADDGDEDRTTVVRLRGEATPVAPAAPPRPRGWRRVAIAAAPLLVAVAAVAMWATGSDPQPRAPPPADPHAQATARPRAASPFDFNGDGRPELAIGMPASGPSHAGAVIVQGGAGAPRSANAVVTAESALPHPVDRSEGFGTSVTSADFDSDGHADLAASAPGRELVVVVHGTAHGLRGGRVERIHATEMRTLSAPGRYGSRLLAADFDHDGFGDLVVGAPGADNGAVGSGTIQMLFGGAEDMRIADPKTIPRPVEDWIDFGVKLRAGDVDGDGNVDLVEGAPDRADGTATGHLAFCAGTRSGRPKRCAPVGDPVHNGTSALAVANVDGDDYDDIVQGDAVPAPGGRSLGGEIRIWRGGRHGPGRTPIVVTQASAAVPGSDEAGDEFAGGVDAGDLDSDGYADIVASAPEENFGTGAVTVIRGGRSGIAHTGHARFALGRGIPGRALPGRRLGASIAVLELSGDKRLDVATAIGGADGVPKSVYVIQGAGKGAFAPGETSVWPLLPEGVDLQNAGVHRMRLGRVDGV
jgi:hypothetical protein